MSEHVILIAGPMGAGKTTAVRALSEIEVVSTEVANSETTIVDKPTTTVALDYGEISLGEDERIRLYGAPGQDRFEFMWRILADRADGLLLLVDNDGPDPLERFERYLEAFAPLVARSAVVVGITRMDVGGETRLGDYAARAAERGGAVPIPVLSVDPREREQMRTLLLALVASIEMRARAEALLAGTGARG